MSLLFLEILRCSVFFFFFFFFWGGGGGNVPGFLGRCSGFLGCSVMFRCSGVLTNTTCLWTLLIKLFDQIQGHVK